MGTISETAFEHLKQPWTPADEIERAEIFSSGEGYWEQRRQEVGRLVGNAALSPAELVNELLLGEFRMPQEYQRMQRHEARRFAVEAVMADPELSGPERFQYLAEIETGRRDVSGFSSHTDVIYSMLNNTPKNAPDGLVLRLDFTDPETPSGRRKFIGATPYNLDLKNLAFYVFDRVKIRDADTSPYLTPYSGLHFRYNQAVRSWQSERGLPDQAGFRVYGIHSTFEDKIAWVKYGGYGWSGGLPERGPAVCWGEEDICAILAQSFAYGGERLTKIKADVGDYPGFKFIHDLSPNGELGSDKENCET